MFPNTPHCELVVLFERQAPVETVETPPVSIEEDSK